MPSARPEQRRRGNARAGAEPMPYLVPMLALASAFLNAGATILVRQGLRGSDVFTGFWINLAVGTACVWGAVLVAAPRERVELQSVAWFVLAGLVGTVAGRLLRFVSIERVGASVTAALTNLYPLVSTILAILLLGEEVTLAIVAGTVVIVAGTVLLSTSGRLAGFRPAQVVLPIMAATCFGVVSILRKLGLDGMGPVLGFAVNVTTALVAFTAFLAASGHLGAVRCRGRSLGYFVAAGVAENAGVFLVVVSLGLGTVSVVAPLTGTAPLFALVMSLLFLRGVERVTGRIAVGTLLIVLGVYFLTAL